MNYLEALRLKDLTSDETCHIIEIVEVRELRPIFFAHSLTVNADWHALTLARTESPIL